MKKNALSLILGATLILPTLAMAAPANTKEVTPADKLSAPVENTLQAEVEGPDGELLATQPGAVESNESVTVADADMDEAGDEENNSVEAAALQSAQPAQALNMQHSDANYQPLIAGEGSAAKESTDTPITLQEKKKDKRGELLATQPADVEFKESRRIAVAR
ncbi:hypothetical protein [Psychrobacter sp. UBA5136]|uniref:hypothetical protein n=1 Tax=Psychrobacter sp. UBA5136 TaxID=1947356 RepID=UPI0025ED36C0|nr:hypothetical protein [Psychrobacter sp. UBA5136]